MKSAMIMLGLALGGILFLYLERPEIAATYLVGVLVIAALRRPTDAL